MRLQLVYILRMRAKQCGARDEQIREHFRGWKQYAAPGIVSQERKRKKIEIA